MENTYQEWLDSLQGENIDKGDAKLCLKSYSKKTNLKYETVLDLQEFIGQQMPDIKPLRLIEVTKVLLEDLYYYEEYNEWMICLKIIYREMKNE